MKEEVGWKWMLYTAPKQFNSESLGVYSCFVLRFGPSAQYVSTICHAISHKRTLYVVALACTTGHCMTIIRAALLIVCHGTRHLQDTSSKRQRHLRFPDTGDRPDFGAERM